MEPPPRERTDELLEQAIRAAVAHASAPVPGRERVQWGGQVDMRMLDRGRSVAEAVGVVGYIAKHATKSTDQEHRTGGQSALTKDEARQVLDARPR